MWFDRLIFSPGFGDFCMYISKGKTFLSPLEYRSPYRLYNSEIMVSNYFLIFIIALLINYGYQPYTIHILCREDQQTFCDCCMPQQNGFVVLINMCFIILLICLVSDHLGILQENYMCSGLTMFSLYSDC
ncbi:hypothetical protein ACJX0J_005425 [Zea mays]